ncbi:hypothetical protein ACFYNO_04145 [Kitasatospora sp. NPDC006697]|uniref:hypothetical protein n=1 Tax=Kitasatospora sp. NPDC006697 TaxID=3364020 RepID=UPI00367C4BCD
MLVEAEADADGAELVVAEADAEGEEDALAVGLAVALGDALGEAVWARAAGAVRAASATEPLRTVAAARRMFIKSSDVSDSSMRSSHVLWGP